MKTKLNYGRGFLELDVPSKNVTAILKPRALSPIRNEEEAILRAIREPIGTASLEDMVDPRTHVALLVSDITRPCPSNKILPPILAELNRSGVPNDHITIFFATGMHRGHTLEEKGKLAGANVINKVKSFDHNSKDKQNHCYLGRTTRGTEIFLNKQVLNCDLLIGVANIDIHYFAGYSGGGKSLLPGVAAFETIQQNHSLMLLPSSVPGKADGNPVREDLEEACKIANFDFIVNAVINDDKEIVKVVAGHYVKAHRAGALVSDYMYKMPIEREAEIVIATAGGFPKDIDLYQAQKGLDNARCAVKDGGTIIFLAECKEGYGDKTFAQWLMEANCPEDIMERLAKGFVLGGHKAYAVARLVKDVEVFLISSLSNEVVKKAFMNPARTLKEALDAAFATHGKDANVIIMPYAGSTLPIKKSVRRT